MKARIFIVIPAYNEESNIVKLLSDIRNLSLPYEKKTVMVDDGSKDNTLALAEGFLQKMDLKIIVHRPNKGVPQTFYDGLKSAAADASPNDIICIIEGDNTSDLSLLEEIIRKVEKGADVVVASRYRRGGRYENFPFHRKWGSIFINLVLKIFFYTKGVTDYTIFFRAYRARVIQEALGEYGDNFVTTKSFAANLEILLRLKRFAGKYDEVPMVYDYGLKKGSSKMNVAKTLLEYKDLIMQRLAGGL
jgi:dolichol-phosphate mannosyltransferase